jgi:hypothetical protein
MKQFAHGRTKSPTFELQFSVSGVCDCNGVTFPISGSDSGLVQADGGLRKGAERGDLNALRVGRIDLGTRRVAGCTNSSCGEQINLY